MKPLLFLITILFFSCKNTIRVSGIVIDQTTKIPLDNVLARTIKDINNNKLEFIETRTKNGRFVLEFSNYRTAPNEIMVELSKEGYLSNMYSCFQDKPDDTLYLVRQR
jgi:hypothetical protein